MNKIKDIRGIRLITSDIVHYKYGNVLDAIGEIKFNVNKNVYYFYSKSFGNIDLPTNSNENYTIEIIKRVK